MAKNNTQVDKNSREYLLRQVANGRYSLLLIVILTVVNLIMTILDTNTYFLFSASVPYYLVFVGMGIENGFVDGAWNVKGTLTYTGLVIALVYLWPVVLIAVVVVFILRKVWKKRPKKEKLPKPAQTPPPAEYPVKPSDEPKPKY